MTSSEKIIIGAFVFIVGSILAKAYVWLHFIIKFW